MITTLEELIAKYPKIFKDYEGNPGRVNWMGISKGWVPIVADLCECIQNYVDHHVSYTKEGGEARPPQVECLQLKEKFGGLRFYTNGHDDVVDGMIKYAEHLCDNTCESCGTREDLGLTKGWIAVLCRKCSDKAEAKWESFEDINKRREAENGKEKVDNG